MVADQPLVPLQSVIGLGTPLFVGCRKAVPSLVFREAELSHGFQDCWQEAKLSLFFRKAGLSLVF